MGMVTSVSISARKGSSLVLPCPKKRGAGPVGRTGH